MPLLAKIKTFLADSASFFTLAVSFLLTLLSASFLASQGAFFSPLKNSLPREFFYFAYLIITILLISFFYFDKNKSSWTILLGKLLIAYLPSEILFIYGLQKTSAITSYVGLASAIYVLFLGIFIIRQSLLAENPQEAGAEIKKGFGPLVATAIVILVMGLNFFFGYYNLGKMALVDEPLWTFDRIPNFWRDLNEKDWRNTNVSDKPGLTVAAIAGIGLLSEPHPKQFKEILWDETNFNLNASKMESFNIAFRFPILIFSILAIPLFYFLIKQLAGRTGALLAVIFVGLSPIILGNSRIINPDSILWIFTSASLLCYLLYLEKNRRVPLFWSAFFLGLAVLTKYTANILYLFFFGLIFAEYLFRLDRYSGRTVREYFQKRFEDFALLALVSFSAIYALYPAVWGKPSRFLQLTIHSQAFEPVWPIFAAVLGLVVLDFFLFKNSFLKIIVDFLAGFRKAIVRGVSVIFILSIFGVLLNVYAGMKFFDFESILASPKSSFQGNDFLGFFLTNFYPLVFGVSALALFAIVIFLAAAWRKNRFSENSVATVHYLLLFVLVYYIGSVASEVASIIRYQIIVFPIMLVASGIALGELFKALIPESNPLFKKSFYALLLFLIITFSFSLYQVRPFYMGYASFLLPEKYYLDVKDMGEGSYEAAEFLNSLPDAGNLDIWTDKRGVCVFFVGRCHSSLSQKLFSENTMEYFVISSGRESRTVKMTSRLKIGNKTFQDLYSTDKFSHKIDIAGRPSNFVKIISPENIQ